MRNAGILIGLLAAACGAPTPQPVPSAHTTATTPTAPPVLTYGQHHHPIATTNPEAQKMFDQGMAQAYGFNHQAPIRSFEQPSELDPNAAMPHWGRAWAYGPNYNLDIDDPRAKSAYDAITKAKTLATDEAER